MSNNCIKRSREAVATRPDPEVLMKKCHCYENNSAYF